MIIRNWIIVSVLLLVNFLCSGQDLKYGVITSDEQGNSYDFRILYKNVVVHLNENVCYYWYRNGLLRSNMGNYSTNLLHGKFEKFDFNGNLCEKGDFKYGTKDGNWTYWNSSGIMEKVEQWNKGFLTLRRSIDYERIVIEHFRNNVLHGKKTTLISGQLTLSQRYKKGKLKKEKDYTPKPKIKKTKHKGKKKPVDEPVKK